MQRRTALLAFATMPACAQNTAPPLRIWVGAPPGGSTDTPAREITPEMGRLLGHTVIVENKSGAGGNLTADQVAKAPPGGSQLLLSFTSLSINASPNPKLPFDPVADVVAGNVPLMFAAVGKVKGLVQAGKQKVAQYAGAKPE